MGNGRNQSEETAIILVEAAALGEDIVKGHAHKPEEVLRQRFVHGCT